MALKFDGRRRLLPHKLHDVTQVVEERRCHGLPRCPAATEFAGAKDLCRAPRKVSPIVPFFRHLLPKSLRLPPEKSPLSPEITPLLWLKALSQKTNFLPKGIKEIKEIELSKRARARETLSEGGTKTSAVLDVLRRREH